MILIFLEEEDVENSIKCYLEMRVVLGYCHQLIFIFVPDSLVSFLGIFISFKLQQFKTQLCFISYYFSSLRLSSSSAPPSIIPIFIS
jgi:hypothetical protein